MDHDAIYNTSRIIGDIILMALLKTLFIDAKGSSVKKRRAFLYICICMFLLNYIGIIRNSYTLWRDMSAMSYFWLTSDIVQLAFCAIIYTVVYLKDRLNRAAENIATAVSGVLLVLNIYDFIVNFKWLPSEGILVFLFWSVNNSGMIAFSLMMLYLMYTKRLNSVIYK